MNVYDFDGTIYRGDSTLDFFIFSIKHNPQIIKVIPHQISYLVKYYLGVCDKEQFKEEFYSFLYYIDDIDDLVEKFWKKHINKIYQWYHQNKKETDIIITASPDFLINPIKHYLGISDIIASKVDKNKGILIGRNCYGKEKVNRFKEKYSIDDVDFFFSDSISDLPMAKLAKSSFMIKNGRKIRWKIRR